MDYNIEMKLLALVLLIFIQTAQAGFIGSAGVGFNAGFESVDYKAANDKSFLELDGAAGLVLEGELPLSFISITSSLTLVQQKGNSEFVRSNGAIISDLESEAASVLGTVGARLRFINFKRFKMFLGGGVVVGSTELRFDKKDFTSKGGTEAEYKAKESFGTYGKYFDIGTEFIIDKKQAARAYVKLIDTKTAKIDAFGDKSISLDYAQFIIQYMYYFDWKFRRSKGE